MLHVVSVENGERERERERVRESKREREKRERERMREGMVWKEEGRIMGG